MMSGIRQNSGAIKQRYVQLFNYRDLVKTGQAQGPQLNTSRT
jgi:hypothetical protein